MSLAGERFHLPALVAGAAAIGLFGLSPALAGAAAIEGPGPAAGEVNSFLHEAWTADAGLRRTILDMLQTRDGYLWLATRRGLVRFDGAQFVSYDKNITSAFVNAECSRLAEDGEGGLWIGTMEGLVCSAYGSFVRYTERDGMIATVAPAILGGPAAAAPPRVDG